MDRSIVKFGATLVVALVLGLGTSRVSAQQSADALSPYLTAGMLGQADASDDGLSAFLTGVNFSSYVQTSYTWNADQPRSNATGFTGSENAGRHFQQTHNEFQLNAVNFLIEKPVDDDNLVGFTVDVLLGQTAPLIQSAGLGNGESLDLTQANIQVLSPWTGGTHITAGKFITTAGAEVIDATQNDNVTRSFLFGYAIPYTHTGISARQGLLTRADGENLLDLYVGAANGWDQTSNNNNGVMTMFSSNLDPNDWLAITNNFFWSNDEGAGSNSNSRVLYDLVATLHPYEMMGSEGGQDLKVSLNLDVGGEENASRRGGGPGADGYAKWWGLAGIIRHDFSVGADANRRNAYLALRGETFEDTDASRSADSLGLIRFDPITDARIGGVEAVRMYEVTLTLGYEPWDVLLLRTELRYDHANQDVFADRGASGDQNNQTTLGIDAIFKI